MPFYFRDDNDALNRVDADTFDQVSEPGQGGQCVDVQYVLRTTVTAHIQRRFSGDAPIIRDVVYTSFPFGGVGGYYNMPTSPVSMVRFGSQFRLPPLQKWAREGVPRANFREARTTLRSTRSYTCKLLAIVSESYERVDGEPDDCGEDGGCTTTFYRDGAAIQTLGSCPPVFDNPEDAAGDCRQCCAQLLPLIRGLSIS